MAEPNLLVGLDANILIAGVRVPRWPYEVMRAVMHPRFRVLLPQQVVSEAQRHLTQQVAGVSGSTTNRSRRRWGV